MAVTFKKGDKVVCLCDEYCWNTTDFINPGGLPEKGKVYVIDSIYGCGKFVLGLNFVGNVISISKFFKLVSGFAPIYFRLLSEIQEERNKIQEEKQKLEMEFSNPS